VAYLLLAGNGVFPNPCIVPLPLEPIPLAVIDTTTSFQSVHIVTAVLRPDKVKMSESVGFILDTVYVTEQTLKCWGQR